MRRFPRVAALIVAAAAVIVVICAGTPAHAQAARTFVSGHGADSGTCAVTAPCRSFAYAITQTASAGEIVVLDSAGYGPFTIAQSVTVTNPGGVEAGVTATAGGNAITTSFSGNATITLRGLTLEGGGVGAVGIDLKPTVPAGSDVDLNLIGCVIKGSTGSGVNIAVGATGGLASLDLMIADSFILNNATNGILVATGNGASMTGKIYRTVIDKNGTGVNLQSEATAPSLTLVDSNVDMNNTQALTIASGDSVTMLRSTATDTQSGAFFDIANGGTVSLFEGNSVGQINNTGTGNTDGTNHIYSLTGTALSRQNPQ